MHADRRGILLYEDDVALAEQIVAAFKDEGLAIAPAATRHDVTTAVESEAVSALIMDRMVGDVDSLTLLEELRGAGHRVPVVVISSLATVDERIRGLKAGGDDYLTKPFAMGELIARVEAVRRRADDDRRISLKVGPLAMDLIAKTVHRGARELDLLPREFSLLEYLMRNANQVVTRAMLLENVWHYNAAAQTNVVDVHVGNLRRKVDGEGEVKLINSVRGLGFRLDA
ncbi:Two component transcriptional regulator [Beijerinckiaceae bacterium RH AL1]|nr:response regulator transcription factor [Beijerinckiaceae bacterium]VVB46918.1 Two component transcriptional regulator [Beijerinckiaceae bacterium RH CH11]VVB47001.1 Two component transcriptional regulator [Beijerinckiaceae bacterium RH AL8]VVC55624.1 Two component transcriptional regulator [Beijerinckiaceae bacterium RH AL1]